MTAPDLHVRTWNPPSAAKGTVWLVHGIGEHSGRYDTAARVLAARGFVVRAHDQRGHGLSPGPRGHVRRWAEYGDDLRRPAGAPRRPGSAAFPSFGHSMGGLAVMDRLLRDPGRVRAAVVSAPAVDPAAAHKPLLVWSARLLSLVLLCMRLPLGLDLESLSRDPAARAAYERDPLVHARTTARRGAEILTAIEWLHAHRAHLRTPLLLLQGAEDRINSPAGTRRFAAGLPAALAEMRELPGVRHELHTDPEVEGLFSGVVGDGWRRACRRSADVIPEPRALSRTCCPAPAWRRGRCAGDSPGARTQAQRLTDPDIACRTRRSPTSSPCAPRWTPRDSGRFSCG